MVLCLVITALALASGVLHLALDQVLFHGNFGFFRLGAAPSCPSHSTPGGHHALLRPGRYAPVVAPLAGRAVIGVRLHDRPVGAFTSHWFGVRGGGYIGHIAGALLQADRR